jgi:phosphatidylinositol glycan class N
MGILPFSINLKVIHLFSWSITILSLIPYPVVNYKKNNLISQIFLWGFPLYILLTIAYEGIFLIIFYNYLQLWIEIEKKIEKNNKFSLIDIFMYSFLIYSSFFSIGGIENMNCSFYRLIYYYLSSQILIYALLSFKIMFPVLLVTASFFEICKKKNTSIFDSLILLIALMGFMSLKFFFAIKESGSFKEIGMSIAIYIISIAIPYIQIIFFIICYWLYS